MSAVLESRATHLRKLLRLGLPLVGASVAAFAIHTTDIIMLGWYDVTALAAGTIASSIWFLFFIAGAGFAHAVTPMVAAAIEEGDDIRARRVSRMALWLSAVYAVIAVAALWPGEALMLLIGQEPQVASEAEKYLRIATLGFFPALGAQVLKSLTAAMGLTAVQLWVTLATLVMNALINYALIFGNWGAPEMGIEGAALASITVHAAQMLVLAGYAHCKRPDYALFRRLWRPDREVLGQVLRLGLPIGLTGLAESGLFSASAVMMGWIGELELAAHGVAIQLVALAFMFHVGMSQAATVRAGGQYGRRDMAALRRGAGVAYALAAGFGVLVVLVFVTIPGPLVSLFVDRGDPARNDLVAIGAGLVMLAALFQFVDSTQIVALSLLRGVQDTRVPMWLAGVSYWIIGIPGSYLLAFPLGFGPSGLWLGLTLGLGCAAVLLTLRFLAQLRRLTPQTAPAA